ncbi:MAG: DUF86 domain-containing protein [Parabacteroides sp.]|nr:DUF86 domain-containing protein [Parabacteroides sp.]
MFDKEETLHLLELIESTLSIIEERCRDIVTVDDFLLSDTGMVLMDSVCMKIIAVGESVKNLDKHTGENLLVNYPEIPWKNVMGTRDIIVHHYFDIDADELFRIVKTDVPVLHATINKIIKDFRT